jgi:hypothetical protein
MNTFNRSGRRQLPRVGACRSSAVEFVEAAFEETTLGVGGGGEDEKHFARWLPYGDAR